MDMKLASGRAAHMGEVAKLIDGRPISRFQMRVFLLCGSVGALDGLNTQSISVAAKFMVIDLHIRMADFGPIFSAMLLGAALGAVVFGALGDRFGRKQPIAVAVIIMAIFTLLTPRAHTLLSLIGVRFLLGIGLGGATPCFLALGSEYAPERLRKRVTSLLFLGFPLGIMLGAFLHAWLIAQYRWQVLFYVGGMAALALLVLIVLALPESVVFLAAREKSPAAIAAILDRLAPGPGFSFGKTVERQRADTRGDIRDGLERPSFIMAFALWISLFMTFGALSAVTFWGTALLAQHGMPVAHAAIAAGLFGAGVLTGVGAAGVLLENLGKTALVLALLLGTAAIAATGLVGANIEPAIISMTIAGFFLGVASSGALALVVQLYPTAARSRGLGRAMGAGRLGQFTAPLLIGLLIFKFWPAASIFVAIAAMPALGALSMLAVVSF